MEEKKNMLLLFTSVFLWLSYECLEKGCKRNIQIQMKQEMSTTHMPP